MRYKITGWLGDGAMGVVYDAVHLDIGRHAALKVLHESLATDRSEVEAFWEEARAATKIGSPYIVEIYDMAELPDGRLVSVMELLDGQTLEHEVHEAPMRPGRLIAILRQACKGLAAAHDEGIVHRDIKPANIFLRSANAKTKERSDRLSILDFGLAVILTGDTHGRELMGTPYYMAPEQILGKPFDGRLDQYALGCTAYELVVGTPPHTGQTLKEILREHLKTDAVPPRQVAGEHAIPEALEKVLLKCLAKTPEERFRDMRDLEAALCEAQIEAGLNTAWDDLPIPDVDPERREAIIAKMPDPGFAAGAKRKPWLIPAVAAATAAVVLGATLYLTHEEATPEAVLAIEQIAMQAREAAARALYLYPPADDPSAPTAYSRVLDLERLRGEAEDLAKDTALDLRREFAETLVYLGDGYWDKEGGKAFAIDYYAQAIVFDESNERAAERASLTPGQLANLKRKADEVDFSDEELTALAPLVVLANKDVKKRRAGLKKLTKKPEQNPLSAHLELAKLLAAAEPVPDKRERKKPPPEPPPAPPPDPAVTEGDTGDAVVVEDNGNGGKPSTSPAGEEPATYKRNPKKAREIARQGTKALRSGSWREAETLFHQALTQDRRCAPALIGLSDVYFERGDHGGAVKYAEKAVAASGKNGGYRIRLGDAYFKVLRYADAKAQYERAKALGSSKAEGRLAKLAATIGG
jgi:tetratricopeptide (TPR) repeat protein